MTLLTVLRGVSALQAHRISVTPRRLAMHLGEDITVVRGPLIDARTSGLLERSYEPNNPFGDRDVYRLTFRGRQVMKEMATP